MITIIAALSANRVIGVDGRLPWRVPADLARFKARTMGHTVVMGRKTHESIGGGLPWRHNVVVSNTMAQVVPVPLMPTVTVVNGIAWDALRDTPVTLFVIGGASVYEQALPFASRLILTLIEGGHVGDAYFPHIGDGWQVVERSHHAADELNLAHTECVLERGDGGLPDELRGWV